MSLNDLEKRISYKFKDIKLLERAVTHKSYAFEHLGKSVGFYENLEFFGDSVINLVITEYLFNQYDNDHDQAWMSRMRSHLIKEETLANITTSLSINDFLILGVGENKCGGRERIRVLADIFESITGAIYLDNGFESAKRFVLENIKPFMHKETEFDDDYKSLLQIKAQKIGANITYKLVGEEGPDHDKTFKYEVILNNSVIGTGYGKSKKKAQQEASRDAIEKYGEMMKFKSK